MVEDVSIKQSSYPAFTEGKHIYTNIYETEDNDGNSAGMFIDGISFEKSAECKLSVFKVGETYDFYMINLTPDSHPIHFHLINFQKIAQIPFDKDKYSAAWFNSTGGYPGRDGFPKEVEIIDPSPFFTGSSIELKESEKSFRDIIDLHPNYVTIIRMKFAHNNGEPFSFDTKGSSYVFHCHML